MLAGNPNAGKRIVTAALAVLVVMITITVLVTLRKKSAPPQQPPLHPSVLVFDETS
jgi:hypothetical protein